MKNEFHTWTIQAACKRLQLPKSTVRYWEKEFADLIRPQRTRGGQRRYSKHDLLILEEISNQKQLGRSLAEIKHNLLTKMAAPADIMDMDLDPLIQRITTAVRNEILCYFKDGDQEGNLSEGRVRQGRSDRPIASNDSNDRRESSR